MTFVHVLGGAPGTGKTSLLNRIQEHPETTFGCVHFGRLVVRLAAENGHMEDPEDRMHPDLYQELACEVADRIRDDDSNDHVVVTCHFANYNGFGYMPDLSGPAAEVLNPDTITVLEASPEVIPERMRDRDRQYERPIPSVDRADEHMEMERRYAVSVSTRVGCPLRFVHNHQGDLDGTTEEFLGAIEGFGQLFED